MRGRSVLIALALATLLAGCADSSEDAPDFGASRSSTTTDRDAKSDDKDDKDDTDTKAGGKTTTTRPRTTTTTTKRSTTTTTAKKAATTTTTAAPATATTAAPAPPTTSSAPSRATIAISGFQFRPSGITVRLGARVTVVNQDGTDHSWASDNGRWNSSNLSPNGGSFTQLFNERGQFPYHCDYHPGMRGTVTVT